MKIECCKKKTIINASNLHVGGGIQVAVSFIHELCKKQEFARNFLVVASFEVNKSLLELDCDPEPSNYMVIEHKSPVFSCKSFLPDKNGFGTVFTVFGPIYRWRKKFRSIVGFAQPWIIYPENECYGMLSPIQRIRTRLKYWIQTQFFKRADVLVVELEHVKDRLIQVLKIPDTKIQVVRNCLSSIYSNESVWQSVEAPKVEGALRLGFLGRNYLHKNTSIFPAVAAQLAEVYGIKVVFYVTFTPEEWSACPPHFRAVCINVGPLTVAQCPRFYQLLDAVIFPSLLECFSATPLEAMAMKIPLFASDRPFNRDVCGPHAHYFDPMSPISASEQIGKFFNGVGPNLDALAAAQEHAMLFGTPKDRAEKYISIILEKPCNSF